ncbi:MAG: hypothetical protein K0U98_11415 [Deltaproteobacteria bacterium]|nr:hypothetical protein [Deltaproteobacteria bacterium]
MSSGYSHYLANECLLNGLRAYWTVHPKAARPWFDLALKASGHQEPDPEEIETNYNPRSWLCKVPDSITEGIQELVDTQVIEAFQDYLRDDRSERYQLYIEPGGKNAGNLVVRFCGKDWETDRHYPLIDLVREHVSGFEGLDGKIGPGPHPELELLRTKLRSCLGLVELALEESR